MNLPRILGLCALAAFIVGAILLVTGLNESSQRAIEKQNGLTKIPHDSEFVRALLGSKLEDDEATFARVSWLLGAAGRSDEAVSLRRFFADCNLRRFVEEDDACRRETVSSAIAKGAALSDRSQPLAVPRSVEARLLQAFSLFWPDEASLRANVGERDWPRYRYEGAGVLRHVDPDGAYVVVAARKQGPWEVQTWLARVVLQRAGGAPIKIECGSDYPLPFRDRSIAVGAEAVSSCNILGRESLEQAVAALRETAAGAAPQLNVAWLALSNPSVRVTDEGPGASPRFKVEPVGRGPIGGLRTGFAGLPHELAAVDCHRLATCPSVYEAMAVPFAEFFGRHLLILPALIGALLGLAIGGLVRRSLTFGGAFAALLVVGAIVGIGLLFNSASQGGGERGFALMGIAVLMYGAGVGFALGLPAFFIGLLLMRALRRGA